MDKVSPLDCNLSRVVLGTLKAGIELKFQNISHLFKSHLNVGILEVSAEDVEVVMNLKIFINAEFRNGRLWNDLKAAENDKNKNCPA